MKTTLLAIAAITGLALPLLAQDDPKPIVIGDFDNSGSVTTGYRFTEVSGYRPMFQQLFDMNSGFRLMDFSLFREYLRRNWGYQAQATSEQIRNGLGFIPVARLTRHGQWIEIYVPER